MGEGSNKNGFLGRLDKVITLLESGEKAMASVTKVLTEIHSILSPPVVNLTQVTIRILVPKEISLKPLQLWWMTAADYNAWKQLTNKNGRVAYLRKEAKPAGFSCPDPKSGTPLAFPTTCPVIYAGSRPGSPKTAIAIYRINQSMPYLVLNLPEAGQ
jgi:hypothetical protein